MSRGGGNRQSAWRERDDYGGHDYGDEAVDNNFQRRGQQANRDAKPRTAAGFTGSNAPMIGKPQGRSFAQCLVGNLKYQATEQDLIDLFKSFNFQPVRARLLYD